MLVYAQSHLRRAFGGAPGTPTKLLTPEKEERTNVNVVAVRRWSGGLPAVWIPEAASDETK